MQESLYLLNGLMSLIGTVILSLILYFVIKKEISAFKRVADIATTIFDDYGEDEKNQVGSLLNNLSPIAEAANNLNAILQSEEAFDTTLTILANKIRKSFIAGLLGEASGDSKRMAKADAMISTAMVDGLAAISPVLVPIVESLGLKEMIAEDPKMFDAILAAVFNKGGLIQMFKEANPNVVDTLGDTSSLATPKGERGEF